MKYLGKVKNGSGMCHLVRNEKSTKRFRIAIEMLSDSVYDVCAHLCISSTNQIVLRKKLKAVPSNISESPSFDEEGFCLDLAKRMNKEWKTIQKRINSNVL